MTRTGLEEGAKEIARWLTTYKAHHEQHHPECTYGIFEARAPQPVPGATPTLAALDLVRAELAVWKAKATQDLQEAMTHIQALVDEVKRLRALLQP